MRSKKSRQYRKLKKSVKEGEILIIPSDDRLVYEWEPPYVAGPKKLPSWFRLSPKSGVRRCAGIQNFLELGIIIPSWTTFSFSPNPLNNDWDFSYPNMPGAETPFRSEGFSYASTGSCPMTEVRENKEFSYPKLVTPFSFITAPGWSLLVLGLLHQPNKEYDVVSAIVNTDYYHEINVVLNIKCNYDFQIRHGEPLFQLIPFKRSGDTKKIVFASEEFYKYSRFIDSSQLDPLGENGYANIPHEYKRLSRKLND